MDGSSAAAGRTRPDTLVVSPMPLRLDVPAGRSACHRPTAGLWNAPIRPATPGHAYAEIGESAKALAQLRFYVQNSDAHDSENADLVLETRVRDRAVAGVQRQGRRSARRARN